MYVKTLMTLILCFITWNTQPSPKEFTPIPIDKTIEIPKESIETKIQIRHFAKQSKRDNCYRACETVVQKFNRRLNLRNKTYARYMVKESGDSLAVVSKDYSPIDSMLRLGIPVIVGVHHTFNYGYNEGTTDHFVIITKKGWDSNGLYYQFFDVGSNKTGTHTGNKFRFNGDYLMGSRHKSNAIYIVTQIRFYKRIKIPKKTIHCSHKDKCTRK